MVQTAVLRLHRRRVDALNWRPNVIVFGGPPSERRHLIQLSRWAFEGHGLSTYGYIMEGQVGQAAPQARQIEPDVRTAVAERFPDMLSRVTVAQDVYEGSGSGGRPEAFAELLRDLLALGENLLLVRHDSVRSFGSRRTIDVWWGGLERNGALMLLLVHWLSQRDEWGAARVRVNVIVDRAEQAADAQTHLEQALAQARIRGIPNVIVRPGTDVPFSDVIRRESARADLVFMGLRPPADGEGAGFVARVEAQMDGLGTVVLVRAAEHFAGVSLLFDD
ncbi:MAG: hypothetical protein BWY94_02534 [Actinobacteria bacterium ADurb.BinA094]|nr:MAG: hypothetical protein BWY94_02534 [Actinobacteria bacterium ADurb.BinA094]